MLNNNYYIFYLNISKYKIYKLNKNIKFIE